MGEGRHRKDEGDRPRALGFLFLTGFIGRLAGGATWSLIKSYFNP